MASTHRPSCPKNNTKHQSIEKNQKPPQHVHQKTIYYAHIYSHLVYGCTIWGNMLRSDQLERLQKLQNSCFRLIMNQKDTLQSHQLLNLMTVAEIIKLHNLKMGYLVQHRQLPEMVINACRSDVNSVSLEKKHKYNTRKKHEPN